MAKKDFPIADLKKGYAVRRASWAAQFALILGTTSGRGRVRPAFYLTGPRGGRIPYTPDNLDDLLAEDWERAGKAESREAGAEPVAS